MNSRTRLALARVQVTDVVRRLIPRLNAANQHAAVSVLLNSVADAAEEIAAEQETVTAAKRGPATDDSRLVTVCDACHKASCWQGIFYCDDYRSAGTVDKPVSELRTLDLEHSDYWKDEEQQP